MLNNEFNIKIYRVWFKEGVCVHISRIKTFLTKDIYQIG